METKMMAACLVRFFIPGAGVRIGLQREKKVYDLTDQIPSIADWLQKSTGRVREAIAGLEESTTRTTATYETHMFDNAPGEGKLHWLPPVDRQEVWAAGVTYSRSQQGRQEESIDGGDIYSRVYQAQRPELFFKARPFSSVGPGDAVGIRRDAAWNVPEPELGLVINPAMEIVGQVIGNDMSSRDIEGANPLYLPQAKVYTAACALGPGILLEPVGEEWPARKISLQINRQGKVIFEEETHTDQLHRQPRELVDFLGHSLTFPDGVVLLTGTGIVPSKDLTLHPDDLVQITIEGIGELNNHVQLLDQVHS